MPKQCYEDIASFKLPRFCEIPNIDLYLDQLIAYIEDTLALQSLTRGKEKTLTTAMVNNYVKQGLIPPTSKKRYSREHVACLMVVCILKQLYTIPEIGQLLAVQHASFDIQTAYDYFCTELENAVRLAFRGEDYAPDTAKTDKQERMLVRGSTIAVAHKMHTMWLCDTLYAALPAQNEEPKKHRADSRKAP